MTRITLLCLALCGCGGSLEAARPARAALSPEQADRCTSLDERHAFEGGLAKAFALVGGTSGFATIPVSDDRARVSLAVTSIGAAGVAVALEFMADAAATSWARECAR